MSGGGGGGYDPVDQTFGSGKSNATKKKVLPTKGSSNPQPSYGLTDDQGRPQAGTINAPMDPNSNISPNAPDRGPQPVRPMTDAEWLEQHFGKAPSARDMYEDGEWNADEFGYEQAGIGDFNEDDFYDVSKIGGEGFELGGYDVAQIDDMNFDPYRRNATQNVAANSASSQASLLGSLARTGGVNASDRMALASQSNRDKIAGTSDALGKYDQMDASTRYDTSVANTGALNTEAAALAQAQNEAAVNNAEAQRVRDADMYGESRRISEKQIADENAKKKADAENKYKQQQDILTSDTDIWYKEGQLKGGAPG